MKRIMIPVLISSFLLGSFPIAFADNSIKIQDNGEYLCFDISEKANCIGFVTTGVKQDGVLYEVPNFIGVGRTSASDGVQDIHNKTAFDKKKDDDGYIYSDNGLPFYVNTVENNKNTILLGKGQYLNNTEFSIDLSDEKLYSISFLSDVTYNVDANSFSITVEYSDGTTVTDNGWVIYPRNNDKQALLNYNGVDSAISFDYNAADAENTALIYRLTASNPQQPLSVSYSLPVYTLKLDSSKKAKKVTVKQLGEYYGMEIFAMTAKRYTYADEILELIDALPQSDEIQYGNYENYKDSVEKIKQAIADGVKLDDERKAKALQIIAKIEEFESNPILFINYTIDNLPQAENITIENYSEYLQSIRTIESKLTGELTIDEERMEKYSAVKASVEMFESIHTVNEAIDGLPNSDEITIENYEEYEDTVTEISNKISLGLEIDEARMEKYELIYNKINSLKGIYNPYITIDFSKSFNAKLFGDDKITIKDSDCRVPNYMGAKNSDSSIEMFPTMILNKNAYNKLKNNKSIIYTANEKIPLYVNTNGGIVLGTNAKNALKKVTIPIDKGYYENINIAMDSTYTLGKSDFALEVIYTDATKTTDPDWEIPYANFYESELMKYEAVRDYFLIDFNRDDIENTSPFLQRKNENYVYYQKKRNIPVISIKTDSTKIVKEITISENDTWKSSGIFAITAQLPEISELKACIEKQIAEIRKSDLSNESDRITAINNMLERYLSTDNAQKPDALDEYYAMLEDYYKNVVQIESVDSRTDFDKTICSFHFKNKINPQNVSGYVEVLQNGVQYSDYSVECVDSHVINVVFNNDFNYDKKFVVTVKKGIKAYTNELYQLREDYIYEFSPVAPLMLEVNLTDLDGNVISDLSQYTGESFNADIALENNSEEENKYALTAVLFDGDGSVIESYMLQGAVMPNEKHSDKLEFSLTGDEVGKKLMFFVFDSFLTLKKVYKTVTKQ